MKPSAQISLFALSIALGFLAFSESLAQSTKTKKLLEYKIAHRIDLQEKANQGLCLAERKIYDPKTKTTQSLKGILEVLLSATFNEKSIRFYDPFSFEASQESQELRRRYLKLTNAEDQEPYVIMPYSGCAAGKWNLAYAPLQIKEAAAHFAPYIDIVYMQSYDPSGRADKKESAFIMLYVITDAGIDLPLVAYNYSEIAGLLAQTHYKAKHNDAASLSLAQIIEKGAYSKIIPRKGNHEAYNLEEAEKLYQEIINEQEQFTQHH